MKNPNYNVCENGFQESQHPIPDPCRRQKNAVLVGMLLHYTDVVHSLSTFLVSRDGGLTYCCLFTII